MDTNKVSTLHSHLKDEYGGESVRLLRHWEFIAEKMTDFRNHSGFMLMCT